jgi:hypothetical protein
VLHQSVNDRMRRKDLSLGCEMQQFEQCPKPFSRGLLLKHGFLLFVQCQTGGDEKPKKID